MSADNENWFLFNASPDLAQQIENNPELQPRPGSTRNSPIAGVFLTNADIDHALGLILLRQRETKLAVHASERIRSGLAWVETLLDRFCGIEWRPAESGSLGNEMRFTAIDLGESVAFLLSNKSSGARALIAPAVGKITAELKEAAVSSQAVLFDGTFWKNDELAAIRPGARDARAMHHLPISDGSLGFLRNLPANRRIYTHINNTNPILRPGSNERLEVEQAGIEIACDGLEILL